MLKVIFKKIITGLLAFEARLILRKYRPRLIAITGSVGKTTTKEAIFEVMKRGGYSVRKSAKSYNSELGLLLSIFDYENPWSKVSGWLACLLRGLSLIIFRQSYPEWLVLEFGIDRPGDMKRLLKIVGKLDLAVITSLPSSPVHMEFFTSPEKLFAEKISIISGVKSGGMVIVNYDDLAIRQRVLVPPGRKLITYGTKEGVDYQVSDEHLVYSSEQFPEGITFKLNYSGNSLPVKAPVYTPEQVLSLIPGLIIINQEKKELLSSLEVISHFRLPPGRLQLIPGLKNSLIIDDTYNSSPAALASALRLLGTLETRGRRIAVLGDMMELGAHTLEAHERAGIEASAVCQILIGVGLRAKFMVAAARKQRFGRKKVWHYDEAREAGRALQNLIEEGDLILVKGSQSMRLERVVEEVMIEPERKAELLCRQEPEWLKK